MPTLDQAKAVSEIFESIAFGLAALLGGFSALKIVTEWLSKKRVEKLHNKWRQDFALEGLGEDFRLLRHSYSEDGGNVIGSSNHVYICDNRSNLKHWVKNLLSLQKLGFNSDQVEGVSKKTLDKFKMGDPIDLNGQT